VQPPSPKLNYVTFSPSSWVLYGQGEGVIEFRDKTASLAGAMLDSWVLVVMSGVSFMAAYATYKSGMSAVHPIFPVLIGFSVFFGFLGIFFLLLRWRTPSFVRISGGSMSVLQPHRWHQPLREFPLSDVLDVETSADSATFHSLFSIGVRLRDGRRICFLRCRDTPEAKWTLNLLKVAIASGREPGAAPELVVSLPPPPLNGAVGTRVAELEEQVIRTAPPARPDSQTASISNRNKV